jgi:phage terminase Nu1 subunit (DNA packaging protein)
MATTKRKSRETPRAIPLAKATEQRARLASAQADLAELKAAALRGELLDAGEVEREWGGVLRTVRASMLAIPSRVGARLPHLTATDIGEIDREVRDALGEVAGDGG